MKKYQVIISSDAEEKIREMIAYLRNVLRSPQAAKNVFEDYRDTRKQLESMAESFGYCQNPRLKKLGYRRINFQRHHYFLMYRVIGDTVFIDYAFHELEDYQNKMR